MYEDWSIGSPGEYAFHEKLLCSRPQPLSRLPCGEVDEAARGIGSIQNKEPTSHVRGCIIAGRCDSNWYSDIVFSSFSWLYDSIWVPKRQQTIAQNATTRMNLASNNVARSR